MHDKNSKTLMYAYLEKLMIDLKALKKGWTDPINEINIPTYDEQNHASNRKTIKQLVLGNDGE